MKYTLHLQFTLETTDRVLETWVFAKVLAPLLMIFQIVDRARQRQLQNFEKIIKYAQ